MKVTIKILTYLFPLFFLAQLSLAQGSLSVTVEGLEKPKGRMMIALYNDASTFMDSLYQGQVLEVNQTGPVTATFPQLPAGTYALSVYHDEDSDGKLDTGLFGIPQEPYGFSQNPTITFGPPSFEKAGVKVGEGEAVKIVIRLK